MSAGQYSVPVTPAEVERQMLDLLKANRAAYDELRACEEQYERCSADWEVQKAKAYLATFTNEDRWTEARRTAYAVSQCEDTRIHLAAATSRVRAARAKVAAIKVEVDLVRSVGTSVRSSLEMT